MKNKQNEVNGYHCTKCETGEGERHGSECSEVNQDTLTEQEKKLLRIIVENEIDKLESHKDLQDQYANILQKL